MVVTIKQFCLTFSEPNVVSQNDHVFNVKGHPFRRPPSPASVAGWLLHLDNGHD